MQKFVKIFSGILIFFCFLAYPVTPVNSQECTGYNEYRCDFCDPQTLICSCYQTSISSCPYVKEFEGETIIGQHISSCSTDYYSCTTGCCEVGTGEPKPPTPDCAWDIPINSQRCAKAHPTVHHHRRVRLGAPSSANQRGVVAHPTLGSILCSLTQKL